MDVKYDDSKVYISGLNDFEAADTFDCGQCFRWNKEADGVYKGIAFGRAVRVVRVPASDVMVIENSSREDFENIWYDYFDLSRDYGEIKGRLSQDDPVMADAAAKGAGIRLLRQDPEETIFSFIISQNSNIPRIKKTIESLCESFGEPVEGPGHEVFRTFPTAETLARLEPEDLAGCRPGYRDKYIIGTARALTDGSFPTLSELASLETPALREALLKLPGVGPKVANCILLFGFGKYDSFPIDVWMKRVMNTLYGFDENDRKGMEEYARIHFGELSGFAQQYLFNAAINDK